MYYARWVEEDKRFAFSEQDNGGLAVTDEEHRALFAGVAGGKVIGNNGDGLPVLLDPEPPTAAHVEVQRLRAYADPISGSDRYFAEALRLQAMDGPAADIEAARATGVERYDAIRALYPWP